MAKCNKRCRMSLTVSQGEGVTVITITANPNSKWPVLCQMLGTLCYSPVCCVYKDENRKLTKTHTALGAVQIIIGIINIVTGILLASMGTRDYIMQFDAPFWLGGVFLIVGIISVLAVKFPSLCMLVLSVILNQGSAALAMITSALYSWDLVSRIQIQGSDCPMSSDLIQDYAMSGTHSLEDLNKALACLYYEHLYKVTSGGLDAMMIVFSVLQFCVTISFCTLTVKELLKTEGMTEDPQLHKPLLKEASVSSA
ncbi:uncharacterized protein LOC127440682 isoform X2 [Myxocyprinus asiaticus]|uniref:uncharacterized protein LOC127440682 isoform X2 n=1 Tax=Myxocyprinus asiaticus TaxID=70543 RepID=UPI002221451A|nr:uncharacterized protein LOC127440682 isoform X2 [Myxocyprinus asiaticus]